MIGTPEDTSSGQRGSEGDVRRGSGFRRGRFPRRLAGIVAFVAVSLFATVWFSSGYLLEWLAGRILPDTLNVSGVSISWRGELLVGKVQASDAGGIWLELDGLKITPHWLRTLTGHPAVASLEISSVTVHRRPRPRMPLRIPVIPGWQRIPPCDHWEIRKLELAQPVAGYSAVYQLNGKIEQGENGLPLLTARLTDTSRQQITVTIGDSLNEPDKSVLLQVTCEGTDTQLLPGWLGTDQPVEVHVSGSGSRDKWAAEISVSAEAQQNLARFRIEASGYETVRYILQGEISGAPARVPYRFIQTAGGPTVVSVETEVDSKGGFRVHSLELNAPLCSVKASGSFHLLDHSLEMDCTASTADIGLLLDGLSAGEKTQQVPLPHDAVPATFSGRAFWRKDVFSLQGEGAASDRKILSLLLDRKGDGTIYGSGRIDLDAVPLPEQWRAIAGSGSVAFTAEGKAGDSGWQVSQVSLESSDWQIRGTATGSGINLLEDPLSGSFSFTAAGKEYAWGTLGQTRGSVSLEGIFKNALSFNVEADCTDGTVYGMRLDGVRLSAAGDIKPHSGTSWTDWLDNLQINLSGTSLVREAHALADPSMQFSAHWEENGRLMLKGVCSAAASRIEAAGTLRFQSGEVDLSGQVRVDFKDILNFSGTDQISAVDGLIEGAFHVARADWNTAPEVRFSAEATGITATEDVKPLDRLLTAIDRRIAGKGEVKVEQDQLSCIVHLEAPSLQRALASLALDLNTSNRDWTVELTSETYPEWIAGLWEGDSAGLKWIKEGKGLLKVKLGGTGTQQPDEIQAGCYWAVSARKRSPVQTIHGAARLSREQAGWTGEVAVQVQPANMDKSVGFSGGIFWKGGGISAPKIQVGFPASGWRKRDGFPLDPEAFVLGNPIGLLAVSFS
ncbi:MAG TPA: hypothetical protein PLX03_04915, partial [Candidatus Hydrogenedentes bacterium]|nr:hypothetical protein [Candidatus Hydrogenedentota bacterium]